MGGDEYSAILVLPPYMFIISETKIPLCMSEFYSYLSGNMSLRNFVILFLLCCFDSDKFSQIF